MTARRLRWAAWPVLAVLVAALPAAGTAGAETPPGATVTVNAAVLPRPTSWANPWVAAHEIDGYAIIVSPADAFTAR